MSSTVDAASRLRVGLIGCGAVAARHHLPALKSLREVEVVAVADSDPVRLHGLADRWRIGGRHTDHRALLADPQVDAVAVCVPAGLHVEVALAALDAGKHVLIEKPVALSLDECDQLIARARESSCRVMVGFNMRWHDAVREARTLVRDGRLGPIEAVCATHTAPVRFVAGFPDWRRRRDHGGGALMDLAVHHFDLWRYLLDGEIEDVFATSRSRAGHDETVAISTRMASGVLATSVCSYSTAVQNTIDVYGEAGRVSLFCYRFDGLQTHSTSDVPDGLRSRVRRIAQATRTLPRAVASARHGGTWATSYREEWRHFATAIHRGTRMECTLEDGRRALAAALAAAESVSRGESVRVSDAPRSIASVG